MKKTPAIILGVGVLILFLFVIFSGSSSTRNTTNNTTAVENSEIRNGVQYITINARGGYSPRISNAKAGMPTKLIVKTNGTYDCSASLIVRSVGFQKILPQTGTTEIDIGTPKAGAPLLGVCGMGMYSFTVNFS